MALMTGEQYIESIRKIPMEIYMFGKKVENPVDNPILRPSLNSVRMTYDLAQMPEYQELMTAISPETGERINRFTHIHRSTEDLRNKVKMQRLLGQKTAACFQRCVGMDAFNAEYSTTYEIDKKYGTSYHENFKKFMLYCQENDLTVDGAMTDVKGDRSKAPHAQDDPDMFLHVVERRPDGVVVCGAKAHQTGIINSHEVIVMPTQSMGPDDKDYAISFAVPLDTKGLFMIIGRQSCDTRKLEGRTTFQAVRQGDATARKALDRYLEGLSMGLINMVNVLFPEIVCLGGGISNADDDLLLNPLRELVHRGSFDKNHLPRVEKASLGNDAGVVGAAMLCNMF